MIVSCIANFIRFLKKGNERGASLVEYGLLLALIAVMGIPAIQLVGRNIDNTITAANDGIGAGSISCTPANPSFPAC